MQGTGEGKTPIEGNITVLCNNPPELPKKKGRGFCIGKDDDVASDKRSGGLPEVHALATAAGGNGERRPMQRRSSETSQRARMICTAVRPHLL